MDFLPDHQNWELRIFFNSPFTIHYSFLLQADFNNMIFVDAFQRLVLVANDYESIGKIHEIRETGFEIDLDFAGNVPAVAECECGDNRFAGYQLVFHEYLSGCVRISERSRFRGSI